MKRKHLQNIYHVNENRNFMEESVTQINGRTIINVDVSVKDVM